MSTWEHPDNKDQVKKPEPWPQLLPPGQSPPEDSKLMTGEPLRAACLWLRLDHALSPQPVRGCVLKRQGSPSILCPNHGNGTSRATLGLKITGALSPGRFAASCGKKNLSRAKTFPVSSTSFAFPDNPTPRLKKRAMAWEAQIPKVLSRKCIEVHDDILWGAWRNPMETLATCGDDPSAWGWSDAGHRPADPRGCRAQRSYRLQASGVRAVSSGEKGGNLTPEERPPVLAPLTLRDVRGRESPPLGAYRTIIARGNKEESGQGWMAERCKLARSAVLGMAR